MKPGPLVGSEVPYVQCPVAQTAKSNFRFKDRSGSNGIPVDTKDGSKTRSSWAAAIFIVHITNCCHLINPAHKL